jgi:signal transduction histidine kinase
MGVQIAAGVTLLVALWLAAAIPAIGDAVRIVRDRTAVDDLGRSTDALVLAIQEERRLSTGYLAGAGPGALVAQRAQTDRVRDELRHATDGARAGWTAGPDAVERAGELLDRLKQLPALRSAIDARSVDRGRALASYTGIVAPVFVQPAWLLPDRQAGAGAVASLSRARESLSREDALLRGALGAPRLEEADRAQLAEFAAVRRLFLADAGTGLTPDAQARYLRLRDDPALARLRAMEDQLATGLRPPATPAAWSAAQEPVNAGLRELETVATREAMTTTKPAAVTAIVFAGLLGGVGLVAVIAVLVLARRTGRLGAPRPPSPADPGTDDTEQRMQALLLDLARRNQSLLHRQLRLLDGMERRESGDEALGDLFRADHLANRVRRNVEKAITLAGGTPGRRWQRPVPLIDVVRGAAAEVAEYARVSTSQIAPAGLAGTAVTDLMHLLAELIDNGTTFAPADTRVRVTGERREDGYLLTVADAGPGMSDDDLATARQVMSDPVPPAGGAWWGLYALGRFADRQGITVQLDRGPKRGILAEVSIPGELLTDDDTDDGHTATGLPTGRVARLRQRVDGTGAASTSELPVVDPQWTAS